jgi:hypothetical protein
MIAMISLLLRDQINHYFDRYWTHIKILTLKIMLENNFCINALKTNNFKLKSKRKLNLLSNKIPLFILILLILRINLYLYVIFEGFHWRIISYL